MPFAANCCRLLPTRQCPDAPLTRRPLRSFFKHSVVNSSDQDRIHLVVDVAETPRERTPLQVGQLCGYKGGNIVC